MNRTMVAGGSLLLACLSSVSAAAETPNASLFPQKSLTLFAEASTNSAAGILHMQNILENEELKITLTASDFNSSVTGKGQNAKAVFFGPGDTTGQAIFKATIPKSSWLPVRVEVSGLWEAGESRATLSNNGAEIGHILVLKYKPPFNVKLTNAPADKPEIVLHRGAPQQTTLKNDDGMTYTITWSIAVDGDVLTGEELTLSPNSSQTITITPNASWFTAAGFIREEARDGTLTLSFRPPGTKADPGWPSKVIPIRVRLNRLPDFQLQLYGYVVMFVLLLGGGVCCLLLRNWVPNRLSRAKLKERLSFLGDRIRELSPRIDSCFRVSLRVARHNLDRELYSRWSFSAELPSVLAKVTQECDALEKLIEQAKQLDGMLQRLEQLGNEGRPPTRLEAIEGILANARALLARVDPPQADIKAGQDLSDEAKRQLDKINEPSTEFTKALVERIVRLKTMKSEFSHDPPKLNGRDISKELADMIKNLFATIEPQLRDNAEPIDGAKSGDIDICVTDLEAIREYSERDGGTGPQTREPLFRMHLSARTSSGLRAAKRLIRQLREGIFPEDIQTAIRLSFWGIQSKDPHDG